MADYNELILADLVLARAKTSPDLDVLTFEGAGVRKDEIRSYQQLWENAQGLARALLDHGMQRGERFALLMQNHPEFVECMIAASITGTVFVPVDPRIQSEKLIYMLNDSACKGVICADYTLNSVLESQAHIDTLEWIMMLHTDDMRGSFAVPAHVSILQEILLAPVADINRTVTDPTEPMQILYTSGTTGDPKGVVIAHGRFGTAASHGEAVFGFRQGDRPYTGLSLTHGNAQFVTLGASLKMGLRAVFSRKFTKSRLWDITRQYACTTFSLLGGMVTAIYSEPAKTTDADNPVRFVVSAGMPAIIWEAFEKRFDLKIFEFYGAVEGGMTIKRIGEGPIGSIGKPAPGLEAKIVNENGNECPAGRPGEILFRFADGTAPHVEYFNNSQASKKKTEGGWLHTGDIVQMDEDGWIYFEYRKGGGIRHNGEFINPGFVEKSIAEHPSVKDVFVYGVSSNSGVAGEKDVVAAIVKEDEEEFISQSIFEFCRQKLEANFIPSYLQVVDEIPKTASEKPLERFLIDMFNSDKANLFKEK